MLAVTGRPGDVPTTQYPCDDKWGRNGYGMFGGLARLGGLEHVCIRMKTARPSAKATAKDAHWREKDLVAHVGQVKNAVAAALKRVDAARAAG